jgi:hypothetical protein
MRALRSPLGLAILVAALLICITAAGRAQNWFWSITLWGLSAGLAVLLFAIVLADAPVE